MEGQQVNNASCHGECARCSFQQRVYCAAYMSRNNYAILESIIARMDSFSSEIASIKSRVNEMGSDTSEFITPSTEKKVLEFE